MKNALDAMANRGSDCAQMAQRGHYILSHAWLRSFNSQGANFGGGTRHGVVWIVMSTGWWESDNLLSHALAHELDHNVFDPNPIHIDEQGYYTKNTIKCAGGRYVLSPN